MNTKNLSVLINNRSLSFWRFQVIYLFNNSSSESEIELRLNLPPRNGSCSIERSSGLTSTPFLLSCLDWFDENQIKDYSISIPSRQLMIANTIQSTIEFWLPPGKNITLLISIRDRFHAVTDLQIQSIEILLDSTPIDSFLEHFQQTTNNPISQLLTIGNVNTVGQLITLLTQILNEINEEKLEYVITSRFQLLFLFFQRKNVI